MTASPAGWMAVADDLTGSADTGSPFAERGYSSYIWLHACEPLSECDVPVFETTSRHCAPEEAYRRVREAIERFRRPGDRVFKKLDSTWKGNLGAELRALHDATGAEVLLSPAHPRMGRTLLNGELYLHGEPTGLHLGTMLPDLIDAPWLQVVESLDDVPQDGEAYAGSGGLAQRIAAWLPQRTAQLTPDEPRAVTVIIGSDQTATQRQRERLLESGWQGRILDVRHEALDGPLFAEACAQLQGALVICGGDTAIAVADHLGARGIRLRGENIPGLPWGWWLGGRLDGERVATKSGGFGGIETIVEAVRLIACEGELRV
ncbi:MAG: four-carbon acid sugar kinase family protein [Bryobacteraceae bacterium]